MTLLAKKPEKKPGVDVHFPDKTRGRLMPDAKLYSITESFGAKLAAPMSKEEIILALTGKTKELKFDPTLIRPPSLDFRVPVDLLREWGSVLLQFDTEALAVYGQSRKDPTKWLAVVPEQEVTSCMADVDSFDLAIETLIKGGYRKIGTIHTHPGNMTTHSGTDENELFDRVGGVHYIITNQGNVSFFYSNKTLTFPLKDYTDWKHVKLWPKKVVTKKATLTLIGENGETDITTLVKKKKPIVKQSYSQYSSYSGAYQGRDGLYDDEYADAYFARLPKGFMYSMGKKVYIGERYQSKTYFVKQSDMTFVTFMYGNEHPCFFDTKVDKWRAGDPSTFKVWPPNAGAIKLPQNSCTFIERRKSVVGKVIEKKEKKPEILGSGLVQVADSYCLSISHKDTTPRFDKIKNHIEALEKVLQAMTNTVKSDLIDSKLLEKDKEYKYFLIELSLVIPQLMNAIEGTSIEEQKKIFTKYLDDTKKGAK